MGTTANFLKLRSTSSTINLNEWHNNFSACKKLAETKNVPLVAVWSNGDNCGFCTNLETCFMNATFKNWMKTTQCVFWFGCCEDKNAEDKAYGTGFNWCYQNGKIKQYPFVRVYWKTGKIDVSKPGADLYGRGIKAAARPKTLVNNLTKILAGYKPESEQETVPVKEEYKVRLNEKLTTAQVNKILDAIDKVDGYCPCQPGKSEDTKCHCKDFRESKKIGEPCICKIYVKQKK